jgi:glycosyltransferase involved in cell wall biosynthesis
MQDSTPPIRLLALVAREIGRYPNLRFRLEQWAPHLERQHGIRVDFASFESPKLSALMRTSGRRGRKLVLAARDLVRYWAARHRAQRYDGAIVVHEAAMLGGVWFERYLVRHGIPFVYDFDDPLWVTTVEFGDWVTRTWRSPKKIEKICRLASAITVGNEYLADWARQFNPHVSIVLTSIDLEKYEVARVQERHEPFTVVWSGQRGASMRFLDSARPALERLGKRMPLKLRVVSTEPPPPYENVQVEYVPWTPEVEATSLASADAGIMPLPDVPSTRGKCGLKALQYMAVGVPPVVSPVGINREIVRDGENGLWAETTEQWTSQLERLATDETLRRRLAAAARKTVESTYTAQHSAAAFAAVVRDMLARAGRLPTSDRSGAKPSLAGAAPAAR